MERPVCWQYVGVGHRRRNCRKGYPQEQFTEGNDRPKAQYQEDETTKETMDFTIVLPTYAISLCDKDGHDSLYADRRIGEKKVSGDY
jgi:hypothetical protein